MSTLVASVALASFLGSLHCSAMCGPFAAAAFGFSSERRAISARIGAYHAGRLTTYLALGVTAGLAGRALDLAGTAAGVGRISAWFAGATLVVMGVSMLVGRRALIPLSTRAPRGPSRWLANALVRLHGVAPLPRAFLMGLATTFVPCGWLYAFVTTAAGTGRVTTAAVVMGSFWIGTVPSLVLSGVLWHRLAARLGDYQRRIGAALVVASGIAMLALRTTAPVAPDKDTENGATFAPAAVDCPLHQKQR